MKIYACPKCGSKNIHIGTMDSGVTYGITSWDYTCKDCDYKGMPLIFYTEKEYQQFLKGLLKEVQSRLKDSNDEKTDEKLNKENKEILKFIKELIDKESKENKDISQKENPNWHRKRSWWPEIILSFIISGILISLGASILLYIFNEITVEHIIYLIIEFFIQAIIILAIIVGIEYFILFKFIK